MYFSRHSRVVRNWSGVLAGLLLAIWSLASTGWAQNYQNDINVTAAWLASTSNPQVTLSDGAVLDEANSTRINPYFANLGVTGFVDNSAYYANIKNYMEWYWNHVGWPLHITPSGCTVNPSSGDLYGAIDDFDVGSNGAETPVTDSPSAHHPDSTDAYAGTFLSLAYQYWETGDPNAQAYIKNITIGANGDRLDYVGQVVLATLQSNNLTCARPDYNIQYLMDNAEAYRGLRDLVNLYTAVGATSKVNYYKPYADAMQNAIQTTLWNSSANSYYTYTSPSGPPQAVNWADWYTNLSGIPDGAVIEIWPIALGVVQPSDPRAQQIWTTFNNNWKTQWTTLQPKAPTNDPFPWAIVGYAAALMGDTTDANTFIQNMEKKYVNTTPPFTGGSWSVNEAGYFIRLNEQMKSGTSSDCHTGSDVSVSLTSPSGSGTYATPLRVTATASSSKTITGYVIYTNASGNYANAYQNNNSATLDAWVILPLTSSGGAQSQNVFVRAWNSAGQCGDSAVLTINASGTDVPTPLAGARTFANADDDTTFGGSSNGWNDCGNCAGGNASTVGIAFGQSPTKDGNGSVAFSVTGGNYANGLFWYKVGAQDAYSNFVWDFWFQLSPNTSTEAQAIEFDVFQAIGGQKYMIGTQCNYAAGVWQAWNASAGAWVNAIPNTSTDQNPTGAAITCSKFSTGTWHHAQFYLQRTYRGRILYGNVTIDGVTTQWNVSAPAVATSWGDVLGFQHQLDTNNLFTGTTTLQGWADIDQLTAWPQD